MKSCLILVALVACCAAKVIEPLAHPVWPEHLSRSGPQGRIIGGFQASTGQFPWQVRILSPISGSQSNVCGGIIISPTHVLTAAHCTRGFDTFNCGFGSILFSNPLLTIQATTRMEHESYNPETLSNDISIIVLPISLSFDTRIRAVQLPSRSQSTNSFLNSQATVSGFGRTANNDPGVSEQLIYANQRVISNSECSAVYGPNIIVSSALCCLGWDVNSQGACHGDSGGPLTINESSGTTLIGLVSFVSSRGCGVDPAGFTRLTSYLDWISVRTGIQIRP